MSKEFYSGYGWIGKILRVNLTNGTVWVENTSRYAKKFIGGIGIACAIYWREVHPEISPFDPENRIIFATGPLTGTLSPGSARTTVTTKSPQSYPEQIVHSNFGGDWGPELKYAGFDAVVIEGRSEKPVYLWIHDGEAELLDATKLWGLDTFETQAQIWIAHGDNEIKILTIGPAGERMVRYACIMHETGHSAGQGGTGAVMGSKNLKAIAVRGTGRINVAEPKNLLSVVRYIDKLHENSVMGATPKQPLIIESIREGVSIATGDLADLSKKYKIRPAGCTSCPIHCYTFLNVPKYGRGEMSCVQFFYGWLQMGYGKVDETFFLAKQLTDKLGINNYELTQLIPYLLVLYNRGELTEEETGIPFSKYPGSEFIEKLCEKIVYRDGIGDKLAEGTWRFAEHLGKLDEYLNMDDELVWWYGPAFSYISYGAGGHGYCTHYDPRDYIVEGLLWIDYTRDPSDVMHDYVGLVEWSGLEYEEQRPIAKMAWGSELAVHPLGEPGYNEHEAKAAIIIQHTAALKNSLTLCDWLFPMITSVVEERGYAGDITVPAELFTAVTGVEATIEELMKVGERIWNLQRAIMVREGRTRGGDTLPERFFNCYQGLTGSPPIDRERWESLKDIYYSLRGWDVKTGIPTKTKLKELGLDEVAETIGV